MKKKSINYYGNEDNYIHLKFGDCMKCYNFTEKFIEKYPDFTTRYQNYWKGERDSETSFLTPYDVITTVYANKIPVKFYFNYTDTPAKGRAEIIEYLARENSFKD